MDEGTENGWMERWKDRQQNGQMRNGQIEVRKDRQMKEWIDGG